MELVKEMLPLLIPILVIDLILAIAAVRHILRHPYYRFGNRAMWIVVSIVFLLLGPVLYFVLGKGKEI